MSDLIISSCCKSSMHTSTSDESTSYFVCDNCGKPADIYVSEKTRIGLAKTPEIEGIKKDTLTDPKRWDYENYKRQHNQALEDYHEFGKAPVGSPERMVAYISQLSLHDFREGARILKEWRDEQVEAIVKEARAVTRQQALIILHAREKAIELETLRNAYEAQKDGDVDWLPVMIKLKENQ